MTAAARAATELVIGQPFCTMQKVALPNGEESIILPVTSASIVGDRHHAIGITHADSGINLDITRGLEIWTYVQLEHEGVVKDEVIECDSWLNLIAGIGVGKNKLNGELCVSDFAQELLLLNLRPLVPHGHALRLEIIFPQGRELAKRTSNEAFGVVDGLALIGTQAEAQVSASPEQLQGNLELLKAKCGSSEFSGNLTLVIGENGLDLASQKGFSSQNILKAGNWLGPLLVSAAELGVKNLLIFGYHGKLVKLAGGIFHTHHHLADARLEVLTALAVAEAIPFHLIQEIGEACSMEEALLTLQGSRPELAQKLWLRVASVVEKRSKAYVASYGSWPIQIGAALFDRQRKLRWAGPYGCKQLDALGIGFDD